MNKEATTTGGCGCSTLLIFLVVNGLFGGWSVRYALGAWMPLIVHHPVVVPFWPSTIAGLFLGEITIPLAIFTWLMRICGVV